MAKCCYGPAVYQRATSATPELPDGVSTSVFARGNGGRGANPLLCGDNDGLVRVVETEYEG